jgi:hypothetical protein
MGGAEVWDDEGWPQRINEPDAALIGAVYTDVQTLELDSETCHFVPLSWMFGTAVCRERSLRKTLQHHEIGHHLCSAEASQNRVA